MPIGDTSMGAEYLRVFFLLLNIVKWLITNMLCFDWYVVLNLF